MAENYLDRLISNLILGMINVPESTRERHTQYLRGRQNPDGGYSGREGESDLYYTSFALRGLAILGELDETVADPAVKYLRQQTQESTTIIDFMSLLFSARLISTLGGQDALADNTDSWRDRVAEFLESLKKSDGGYGKSADAASASTYHSFLVLLTYELLGRPIPEPDGVVELILSRQRDDGGFTEVAPARKGGSNPTAAAIAILHQLDALPLDAADRTIDFLLSMESGEGGFQANLRAPMADVLSTFTSVVTMIDLKARDELEHGQLMGYIQQNELPTGGFRGGLWDQESDVEYTFYGLGSMALLMNPDA